MEGLGTKLYGNYYDKDNKSTQVEYAPTASGLYCGTATINGVNTPQPCDNELYGYTKWNLGAEGFWRFMPGNRLGAGVDYLSVEQERPDYDEYDDLKLWFEYKNTMLPGLSGRIKYTYLERDANFLLSEDGSGPNDPLYLERFNLRPGVQAFMTEVLDRFAAVRVWTAASRDYAGSMLDQIVERDRLRFLFTRERCTRRRNVELDEVYWIKDIRKLRNYGLDKSQILSVDDNARGLERSYANLVRVPAYSGNPDDHVLTQLLAYLDNVGSLVDVRKVDKRGWQQSLT